MRWSGLRKLARPSQPDVRNMQIEVRWRPQIANDNDNDAFDKSFSGEVGALETEVLAHIDRLYLNQTTIKHPDRAEASKFWNFSMLEIAKNLQSAILKAVSQDAYHLWIDISHSRIDIRLADSGQFPTVRYLSAENLLATVQAHPLYKMAYAEADAGATR